MISIMLPFFPYAFVTAFTPGPNNILALNAISIYGWRRGKMTMLGIFSGFLCVMLLCAAGCFGMARLMPKLTGFLKYIGVAYIVWLSLHVLRSKPGGGEGRRGESFWIGFTLQFVNVKIILYAVTVYTGYVLPFSQSPRYLLAAALCLTLFGVAGSITWGVAGGVFQGFIARHYKPFNAAMALLLMLSAVQLVLS